MSVLQPSEYDASYFDGGSQTYQHNAGYTYYRRWYRREGVDSQGEFWKDYAKKYLDFLAMANKKVLVLGCAKGFVVEDLIDMGVDAYGMDVSSYAIVSAEDSAQNRRPDLASRFYVGDVRSSLSQFNNNEFDIVFSNRLFECIDPNDVPGVVTAINRIARKQVHVISTDQLNVAFYTQQPLSWWIQFSWKKGTILVNHTDFNDRTTK